MSRTSNIGNIATLAVVTVAARYVSTTAMRPTSRELITTQGNPARSTQCAPGSPGATARPGRIQHDSEPGDPQKSQPPTTTWLSDPWKMRACWNARCWQMVTRKADLPIPDAKPTQGERRPSPRDRNESQRTTPALDVSARRLEPEQPVRANAIIDRLGAARALGASWARKRETLNSSYISPLVRGVPIQSNTMVSALAPATPTDLRLIVSVGAPRRFQDVYR